MARFALAAGGYAFTVAAMYAFVTAGFWTYPGGDAYVWDRVGDQLRAGISPYYSLPGFGAFYYAPPWAIAFALVSWLPVQVVSVAILVAEVLSLRYVVGSWYRVGYVAWLPLVPLELIGSQWNLVMAAAIAAAMRGEPRPAVLMAFAKLSPVLAIDPRHWRRVVPVAVALVAVTLVWPGLWLDWSRQLADAYGSNIAPGAQLMVPFLPRLAVALGLLAIRRPWSRGLAAIVALPTIYWVSFLLLLALIPPPRSGDPNPAVSADEPTVITNPPLRKVTRE
ncbi:MAG TPA: hypothetical protein VEX41_04740 [Candidatus Eisenbacteria bacterium]|nr:hypothetical protein [Candidatus Eisenbacteria bacterium]